MPAAAPAARAAAAPPPGAAMALLPVWPSTRPPAAAAAMPPMASAPQGGRPIQFRLSPEAIEATRQASTQFGRFGAPSRASSSQPQVFDISLDDPDIEMKDTLVSVARQIFEDFRTTLMNMYEKTIVRRTTRTLQNCIEQI